MRKVSGVICLCCLSVWAIGQTEQADSIKNHIGFNTSFLFSNIFQTSPNASPFSMMYKRQVKENRAIRFGAGMLLYNDNTKLSNPNNTINRNRSELQLTIGEEFQKKLSRHWIWYGGGDIVGAYTNTTNEFPNQKITSYGARLRPFLGVRFDINPRLYLSTEASINLAYTTTTSSLTDNGVTTEVSWDGFSFVTAPAAAIFFFYRF